jgi:hypothetical protein
MKSQIEQNMSRKQRNMSSHAIDDGEPENIPSSPRSDDDEPSASSTINPNQRS